MPDSALILAIVMIFALNFYALMGGADYGSGVWDLLAMGPRRDEQRKLIADAIAPIWEANHVWLILVVVVLFSAFPKAFALLSVSMHIPLTLILFGIIARGTAFIFRKYDSRIDEVQRRWGTIFAISSLITPMLLGVVVAAISSGNVLADHAGKTFVDLYIAPWCSWFCLATGIFAVTLFSFLAANYLAFYAGSEELKSDFRNRAIVSQVLCGISALSVWILADLEAPDLRTALANSPWSLGLQAATAMCAMFSLYALVARRFQIARLAAALQVSLIIWGWALSQYPYMIRPVYTIAQAAGPASTCNMLVIVIALGACLLFPAFYFLYSVFNHKSEN
ncbi:MAG: cytochrome d ubiquinol oxidase subunit II [Candidatus Obscuribacterales bacterium]|jgi:cytochrome bd ubiquinol oxidase subunit II|nr:cytochrome d ubiquinol oxidase subunit II [Candidatus Obscuribacterales bacterium]